jgi:hypothetical protein
MDGTRTRCGDRVKTPIGTGKLARDELPPASPGH